MMTLEAQQRGLLDLVKMRGAAPVDPYLRAVEGSAQLAVVREIALWWRVFALEAQCRLTSRLLKRLELFEETVAFYFDNNPTSPFVEELSFDFLDSLSPHHDPLIRAVSQSERALLKCKAGTTDGVEILWDRHPDRVFHALENRSELESAEAGAVYRLRIDAHLPGVVACRREEIIDRAD
jgi:hypothetical protein